MQAVLKYTTHDQVYKHIEFHRPGSIAVLYGSKTDATGSYHSGKGFDNSCHEILDQHKVGTANTG